MRKKIDTLLDSRLFFIILSIVAAFMIWLWVVNAVNPNQVRTLTFHIQHEGLGVLEDYNLRLAANSPATVSLQVDASVADMNRLEQNPYIVLDVSGIREMGEHDVSFHLAAFNTLFGNVNYRPWPRNPFVSNTDNTLIVRVNRVTGRTMAIETTGISYEVMEAEAGDANYFYVGERLSVYPETLQIDGPKETLDRIATLEVVAEFPVALTETTTEVGTIRAYDHDGELLLPHELEDVIVGTERLNDVTVSVTVAVRMVKNVPLRPVFEYAAGANEENLRYRLSQERIWLMGDGEVLRNIEYLELARIRLDQIDVLDAVRLDIPLPALTEIYDGATYVELEIQILDVEEDTFDIPASRIFFTGLVEGLVAELVIDTLSLVIRGPSEILEQLDVSDISVLVNLTEYEGRLGRLIVESFSVMVGDWEPEVIGAMDLPGQGIIVNIQRDG